MRIGGSLFLIALGAVLAFAVNVNNTHGFNVNTAGVILMIVGAIGLLASALWMSTRRRTDIVERGPLGTRGTTVLSPHDPVDTV
jgi:hypothetical protein